jgi:hypothetical protein
MEGNGRKGGPYPDPDGNECHTNERVCSVFLQSTFVGVLRALR